MSERELFVVTGGGSGMGRDIALTLSRNGDNVVVVGRRQEPLDAVATEAGAGPIETVRADVSTADGATALTDALGGRPIDGIVTAAGGQGGFRSGGDVQPEEILARWNGAIEQNLLSAVLPTESLAPMLRDGRGRVVLIGSTAALDGQGGPYATAKAALTGYGMDLARRLGARGITVNVVAPGFVSGTDFFEAGGFGTPSAEMLDAAASATLVGRVGDAADVTHVVLSLLAEAAGWITGQVISPNGGTVLVR